MSDILLADTDADIAATFKVMVQLRTHLDEAGYVALIRQMQHEHGYRLVCVRDDSGVVAVAGFRVNRCLAWGRFLYIDDLISDEHQRSQGHGDALFDWIDAYAKAQGCTQIHLDSGVQRHAAHRFYLRERMDITCYHFARVL